MNLGSVRKRLDRLENTRKAQIEAAAPANAPTPEVSQEEEERQILTCLWLFRESPAFTAEEKSELERLRALYPDHIRAGGDDMNPDEMSPLVKLYTEALEKYSAELENDPRRR
jgi:hypothetical protein